MLPHSLATFWKTPETVLRTEDELDLKYSVNLAASPDEAAVAAAEARDRQLLMAVLVWLSLVPVQSD